MTRDRSRDQFELRLLGLSAMLVAGLGGAYGAFMEPCAGAVAGAVIGAFAGLIVSPLLAAAVGENSHPLVLPYVFFPALAASLVAGWLQWESPAAMLTSLGVYATACLTAGKVLREKPVPPGHCRGCGCDMSGIAEPRCPECGWRRVVRKARVADAPGGAAEHDGRA